MKYAVFFKVFTLENVPVADSDINAKFTQGHSVLCPVPLAYCFQIIIARYWSEVTNFCIFSNATWHVFGS